MRVSPTLRKLTVITLAFGGAAGWSAVRAQSAPPGSPGVTAADVRFMQEMIGHHQQAVQMTALIATRTRRPDIRMLGERISVSQADEIAMMRRWLEGHAGVVPPADVAGHAAHDHAEVMPGMLTPAQMLALHRATGARFDRLFLQGMIQHHTGALAMVESLRASPGAAQDPFINRFVIDISADQRAEIARMRRMLFRQ